MILTDYYKMKMLRQTKSNRFDCVCSTRGYGPFESVAAKSKTHNFFCYLVKGVPRTFTMHAQKNAPMAITNSDNISSIYMPDFKNYPFSGFGDTKGTTDALLFQFNQDYTEFEIFVARGRKFNSAQIYQLFTDGELSGETAAMRGAATDVQ